MLPICLFSCNRDDYFEKYIGTWQPGLESEYKFVSRIQFLKLNDFYLAGIEYREETVEGKMFFYVCEKGKNYLLIKPDEYFREGRYDGMVITRPTKIYLDIENNNLYFLNTVFKPCPRRIFSFGGGKLEIHD
jgi:hypothetical protein